jgi:glutaminyl-peptide cyclotransferase
LISYPSTGNWLLIVILVLVLGCNRQNSTSLSSPASPAPAQQAQEAKPLEPMGPSMQIDPARAWQYVKDIVAIGPRWDGGPGQKKMGEYIHRQLKSDQVEEDGFVADTPAGKIPIRNIIAKFPGTKDGIIVLGSHIDTNYPLRNTTFAGANDGGSSTALLLAIADQLRSKKLEGYSVWLAFLDGEESIASATPGDIRWSDRDSLYGSRHLSEKWEKDGTNRRIKAFLLADMIGDKDLDIFRDGNSTPWLEDVILRAAQRLGYQSYFFAVETTVTDDHMSFARFGVPVADVVDLNYGYNNSYHHTTQDTLDKISPKSMQIAGDVILETIRLLNAGAGPGTK